MTSSARDGSDPLRDRVALVTGAGRGIGRAVALELAAHGCPVVLVARSTDQLTEVARTVIQAGGRASSLQGDVAELKSLGALAEFAATAYGPIEILVNNAARVDPLGPTADLAWRNVRDAFALNVLAPMGLTAAVLPGMVAGGWGRIANVSSGVVARPAGMIGANTYVATKGALEGHTLNLAVELEGTGVTANVYRPGTVDTDMQTVLRSSDPDVVGSALVDRFTEMHSSGRLISAEDSARVLADHLASEDSGSVWQYAPPAE